MLFEKYTTSGDKKRYPLPKKQRVSQAVDVAAAIAAADQQQFRRQAAC